MYNTAMNYCLQSLKSQIKLRRICAKNMRQDKELFPCTLNGRVLLHYMRFTMTNLLTNLNQACYSDFGLYFLKKPNEFYHCIGVSIVYTSPC